MMRFPSVYPFSRVSSAEYVNPHAIAQSESPEQALFDAIQKGDLQQFSDLLERLTIDLTVADNRYRTALHQTIEAGNDEMTVLLVAKYMDGQPNEDVINALDAEGYTPVMRAAQNENVPVMQSLIKAGGRHNSNYCDYAKACGAILRTKILTQCNGSVSQALANCIRFSPGIAKFFFDAATPEQRFTLARVRAENGWDEELKAVLALGVEPSPLLEDLAAHGIVRGVQTMRRIGADVNASVISFAQRGMTNAVQTLLAAGIEPRVVTERLLQTKDAATLDFLIRAGMPTVSLLVDYARESERGKAMKLISLNADVATALSTLVNDGEQDAANILSVAMAMALLPEKAPQNAAPQ